MVVGEDGILPVRKVVHIVGIVVDDKDADVALGLQERDDRIAVVGLAAVREGEFWLGGD